MGFNSAFKGLINLHRRAFTMFLYRMLSSYCQNWATGITSPCRFTEVGIWVAGITIPTSDMLISVLGLHAGVTTLTFCSFHSSSLTVTGQYLNMHHGSWITLSRHVAVTMWQIPDAVDTVVCAPNDGWRYHPKHVEQFPDINKLCKATSCWIYIGILVSKSQSQKFFWISTDELRLERLEDWRREEKE